MPVRNPGWLQTKLPSTHNAGPDKNRHRRRKNFSLQAHSTAETRRLLQPLPSSLRRLWALQSAFTMAVWAFYTASPFIFEMTAGIPPGSLRR